ncbi:MAG: hypothetical protein GX754_02200 [Clostridiaceae bacterium]|nr:hypothetical protein [Clostridiaceae bacterium]
MDISTIFNIFIFTIFTANIFNTLGKILRPLFRFRLWVGAFFAFMIPFGISLLFWWIRKQFGLKNLE